MKATRTHSPKTASVNTPVTAEAARPVSKEIWHLISEIESPIIELKTLASAQFHVVHTLATDSPPKDIPFDLVDVLQERLNDCVTELDKRVDALRAAARAVPQQPTADLYPKAAANLATGIRAALDKHGIKYKRDKRTWARITKGFAERILPGCDAVTLQNMAGEAPNLSPDA